MPPFADITLAILAGGKASRMGGKNKALLKFEGETFISRIHQNLAPLFSSTIVISNDQVDYGLKEVPVFKDIVHGMGPIGGIHSALSNSVTPYVFVVSCDMPFADSSIAEMLMVQFYIEKPELLIPRIDQYSEPLFAIYSANLKGRIELLLKGTEGIPITYLMKNSKTLYFDLPGNDKVKRCFTNINSFDDLKGLD